MSAALNRMSLAVQSTLIFITVLTITAEISEPFKSTLTTLSGHHWLSKSILSLFFFSATLMTLKAAGYSGKQQRSLSVSLTLILCSLVLLFYFSVHYIGFF